MDNAYVGALDISSGYRCPAGNKRVLSPSPNSIHTRGRALDYNQGASQSNYDVAVTAAGMLGAGVTEVFLYEYQNNTRITYNVLVLLRQGLLPLPTQVNYAHGHVAW